MAATYNVLVKNGNDLADALVDVTALLATAIIAKGKHKPEDYDEFTRAADSLKVWRAGTEGT
jgi:hypothetical protein